MLTSEKDRGTLLVTRWHFRSLRLGLTIYYPPSSPFALMTPHCSVFAGSSTTGNKNNWKPEEWKKPCLGNLTLAPSHTVLIKHPPFCLRCPSGEQGNEDTSPKHVQEIHKCLPSSLKFISSASGLSLGNASTGNPFLGERCNSGCGFLFPFIQIHVVRLVRTLLQLIMPRLEYSPRIYHQEASKSMSTSGLGNPSSNQKCPLAQLCGLGEL